MCDQIKVRMDSGGTYLWKALTLLQNKEKWKDRRCTFNRFPFFPILYEFLQSQVCVIVTFILILIKKT